MNHLKLKKSEVNWARVAELCQKSVLGSPLRETDQEYIEAAFRADGVKYGEVSTKARRQAQDDYRKSFSR